jgi:sigma-B regulation protein RsbU (phosphoserine phosphatase)
VNAGHAPAPVLVTAEGKLRRFRASGPPLGPSPDFRYRTEELTLEPGGFFFACSDGVTEAADPEGGILGEAHLERLLSAHAGSSPERIQQVVREAVREHSGAATVGDDLTLIALQRRP